jgi:meckelin
MLSDKRLSFDSLLFYGNELMLLVFEVLFFAIIDLATQNYIFDGAMLYLLMEVTMISV